MVKARALVWVAVALMGMASSACAEYIAWDGEETAGADVQRALESRYISRKLADLGMEGGEIEAGMPTLSDAEVHYFATNLDVIERGGDVTGRTAVAGLCSFFLWPGIGQHINDCPKKKVGWHVGLGLTIVFRLFSGPDAFIGRTAGFWDGRI